MAKFFYKMENILGIKYKMEEQAKTAYGNARLKLTEEEDKLYKLNQKLYMYHMKLKSYMEVRLNLQGIKQSREAIDIIKIQIGQQQIAVKKAKQQLELARIRLNNAMLERKTHEKLKENAFEVFKQEFEATERKEIDELVSFKFNNPTVN